MDWTTFHEALRTWLTEATQVDVIWLGEAVPEMYAPLCEMQILSVKQDGPDTITRTDPDPEGTADLNEMQCGSRLVMVQVRARTRDYDPRNYALALLEKAKASLMSTKVIAELEEQGLAPVSASDIRMMPTTHRGRLEQEGVFDLECSVSVHEELGTVGWFNRVRVTSALRSVSGSALPEELRLTDEEIGPP
jgi:hypothetical protein